MHFCRPLRQSCGCRTENPPAIRGDRALWHGLTGGRYEQVIKTARFNPEAFKAATKEQWNRSAQGWNDQSARIRRLAA